MNRNDKNKKLKDRIFELYGNYNNFAIKTGYSKHYISNVINGRNPMTDDFKEVLRIALNGDYIVKNDSKDLVDWLFESSSLRTDLLNQIKKVIKDLLDNINLTDELCARINNDTYDFVKCWIEG